MNIMHVWNINKKYTCSTICPKEKKIEMERTNYHFTGLKKIFENSIQNMNQKKWFNILSIVSY